MVRRLRIPRELTDDACSRRADAIAVDGTRARGGQPNPGHYRRDAEGTARVRSGNPLELEDDLDVVSDDPCRHLRRRRPEVALRADLGRLTTRALRSRQLRSRTSACEQGRLLAPDPRLHGYG